MVGSPGDGIVIGDGATVSVSNSLIAAVWNTGDPRRARNELATSRSRTATSATAITPGIVIGRGQNDVTVQRCRISGAAWHGIRYDDASPTIADNLIFANARCGIYASGKTAAQVRGNVFWKNEMNGVSCWFENRDRIANNTFAANLREGLSVLGASEPVIERNIFWQNPQGILRATSGTTPRRQRLPASCNFARTCSGPTASTSRRSAGQLPGDAMAPASLSSADFPGNQEIAPGFRDSVADEIFLARGQRSRPGRRRRADRLRRAVRGRTLSRRPSSRRQHPRFTPVETANGGCGTNCPRRGRG